MRVNDTKHRIDHAQTSSQTNAVGATVESEHHHHLGISELTGDILCSNEDPKLAEAVGGADEEIIQAESRLYPSGAENGQVTGRPDRSET